MMEQQRTDEEPHVTESQQFSVAEPHNGNKLSKGAFSKLDRELTEDDLKSPGTQRRISMKSVRRILNTFVSSIMNEMPSVRFMKRS